METTELSRIHWACRRGMLELDRLLESFFLKHYSSLNQKEQEQFVALLACADQDLFNWLLGEQEPDNDDFKTLCYQIRKVYIQG